MSDGFEIGLGRAVNPLVLALDIGSSASRGALYDATGRGIKPREKRPHSFITAADGTAIIDPDQVLAEVISIISDLVEAASGREIAAVGLDTFATSLVGVDHNQQAITPCYTYSDSRCQDQVTWLRANADEDEIQERTGCRFHSSYLPARFRWLSSTQPELFNKVTSWLSLGEYLYLKLLGHCQVGTSTAAWSGLLNRGTGQWDELALQLAGISADNLASIADPDQTLSPLANSYAAKNFPQLNKAQWFAPVGDGYSSTLGLDPVGAVINLATSGAMRVLIDDPIGDQPSHLPRGLWSYRVNRNQSLVGGAINDVGRAISWLKNTLILPDDLNEKLASPPDSYTPLALPFFTGERSTGWKGDSQAAITNISIATEPYQLYRGVAEGIVWSFERIADELAQLAGNITEARLGGRVSKEVPELIPLLADGLGIPITTVTIKRSTLRGTALIALNVIAPDIQRCPALIAEPVNPVREYHPYYRKRMDQLNQFYLRWTQG